MKILFLDAYFPPEQIAFTHLENDLLEKLVDDGNEVFVICPVPTRGIDRATSKKYRNIKHEDLYGGQVHVVRFSAPQEGKNPLIRAARYFWCNLRTYQIGKRNRSCDLVFCNSTPPTQGWIAGMVARKLGVSLIYSLQDVFPDSLVTTGLSRNNSLLWKIGRKLEDKTYKGCDRIIVISKAMRENLLLKGVDNGKIRIINNWIDADRIKPVLRANNRLFDEFGIDRSKFIVLYAGNFGKAQGAEIILDAAEKMQHEKDVAFVIFGGGTGYDSAAERTKDLKNVFIHPLMPQNRISEVYSMGDVSLVTSRRGVGNSGMPSKTWSIMACNTPIIASFDLDSELCTMIEQMQAGLCVEPENVDLLVDAIRAIRTHGCSDADIRSKALRDVSKEACTSKYLEVFESALMG